MKLTKGTLVQNFDHLFGANNPLNKEGKPHSSHYLQSKIVRAKERIEAELFATRGGGPTNAEGEATTTEGSGKTGEAGETTGGGKEGKP